jgi:hypothetical protein
VLAAPSSAGFSKARGTLVYSIGYDLDAQNGGANRCEVGFGGPLVQPPITAFQALHQIATGPETFYNQPTPGQLKTIFTQIASDISRGARAWSTTTLSKRGDGPLGASNTVLLAPSARASQRLHAHPGDVVEERLGRAGAHGDLEEHGRGSRTAPTDAARLVDENADALIARPGEP